VEDAGFLSADDNWLLYATAAGHELLEHAVRSGRRFTTPLRYALAASQPLPAIVLTDTPEPVAAYVVDDRTAAEHAQQGAGEAGVPAWVWRTEHTRPPLPVPRFRPRE
jgi:hypothetical protein